jgi:hypothetical protein
MADVAMPDVKGIPHPRPNAYGSPMRSGGNAHSVRAWKRAGDLSAAGQKTSFFWKNEPNYIA